MTNRISQYFDDEPDRVTEVSDRVIEMMELSRRIVRETAKAIARNDREIAALKKAVDAVKGKRK